jgi:hypothetical protein
LLTFAGDEMSFFEIAVIIGFVLCYFKLSEIKVETETQRTLLSQLNNLGLLIDSIRDRVAKLEPVDIYKIEDGLSQVVGLFDSQKSYSFRQELMKKFEVIEYQLAGISSEISQANDTLKFIEANTNKN